MTSQELAALVQILNRAPVTRAEHIWLQIFIKRLETEVAILKAKPEPPKSE